MLAAAGVPLNDVDRMDALTRLEQILTSSGGRDAAVWTLHPDRAGELGVELDTAAGEPSTCESCGRWIEQPSSLNTLTGCGRCHARQMGENQ
jgi:hypothetical protein